MLKAYADFFVLHVAGLATMIARLKDEVANGDPPFSVEQRHEHLNHWLKFQSDSKEVELSSNGALGRLYAALILEPQMKPSALVWSSASRNRLRMICALDTSSTYRPTESTIGKMKACSARKRTTYPTRLSISMKPDAACGRSIQCDRLSLHGHCASSGCSRSRASSGLPSILKGMIGAAPQGKSKTQRTPYVCRLRQKPKAETERGLFGLEANRGAISRHHGPFQADDLWLEASCGALSPVI